MSSAIVMDEDEPSRALLAEWLSDAGYRVREASLREVSCDGGAAVDLVLIDLPKLRLNGAELIACVRAAQPGAALLGLSTQVQESLPPASALVRRLGLCQLLAKPCTRDELLAAAAAALAAGRAR